jgi:beta-lactamase superfamily II metal-dependent hydrolase
LYDIDFLAVENEEGDGSRSGDAIIVNTPDGATGVQRRIIIDAGFSPTGDKVVENFRAWYNTDHVDLVISTHPDTDHLNGLLTVIETLDVDEVMMHLPWNHNGDADRLGNYERIEAVYDAAVARGIRITEPFAGAERFGGAVRILGPSISFYEHRLMEAIDEVTSGTAADRMTKSKFSTLLAAGTDLLERALSFFPAETLNDTDDTGPRNQMSVITLICDGARRMLLTGDAGISAINDAAGEYETTVGSFAAKPLTFFQAPHHGSKHNLGPTVLDRVIGTESKPHGPVTSFVSSAKASKKHPSPKVTNALGRRGATVITTEGLNIHHGNGERPGYKPCTPVKPLQEDDGE